MAIDPATNKLVDEVFQSTPLLFIRDFLRTRKAKNKAVRIGTTVKEVRANLEEALEAGAIRIADVEAWLQGVEGYGQQHLYVSRLGRGSQAHPPTLNTPALRQHLKKRGLIDQPLLPAGEAKSYWIDHIEADDLFARISWRANVTDRQRDEALDRTEELELGTYEFHAYRLTLRKAACRLVLRKTDSLVLALIDVPLGEEHDKVKEHVDGVGNEILGKFRSPPIPLGPIVQALDANAVDGFSAKARRGLSLSIAPTEANYRTDGAEIRFKSTRQSAGYTDSDAARDVRRAMEIRKFVGQAGKFRLLFRSEKGGDHDMTVSINAREGRMYLFSRMSETEVLALADQLIDLT